MSNACAADSAIADVRGIVDALTPRRLDTIRYDTIRDAILTCARKPTRVGVIYRTETTTENCKTEKLKSRAYSKRVFALIVHSELKSVHPGFPVAFIFLSTS